MATFAIVRSSAVMLDPRIDRGKNEDLAIEGERARGACRCDWICHPTSNDRSAFLP